jgi:hypothetical protein
VGTFDLLKWLQAVPALQVIGHGYLVVRHIGDCDACQAMGNSAPLPRVLGFTSSLACCSVLVDLCLSQSGILLNQSRLFHQPFSVLLA